MKLLIQLFICTIFCLEAFCQDPQELFSKGKGKLESGYYSEAFEFFNLAFNADSSFVDALINQGYCRFQLALNEEPGLKFDLLTEQAIKDFNKAIKLSPKNAKAFFYRGMTKSLIPDKLGRMRDYNKAIELDPTLIEVYIQKSAAIKQDDLKRALEVINTALEIEPENGWLYSIRGDLKNEMNLIEGACEDWSLAIDLGYFHASTSIKKNCK